MPVDSHVDSFSARLLGWYDRAARALPWRIPPGSNVAADPYRVWLSEIMLQQTTVAAVIPYFERFTARWPTVEALAEADDAELMAAWAGLGYYARARNLLACARAVAAAGGFPNSEDGLLALPGVGSYTAAAIAAIAFDRPAAVVDGNIERVISRVFAIATPLPAAKPEIRTRVAEVTPTLRPGDFAQAMMDLGATVCTPRRPRCDDCPLASICAAKAAGTPDAFPVKSAKRARPTKLGTVYWLEAAGSVLLVTRPARGLLGGMAALPTGPWTVEHPGLAEPPAAVDWTVRPAAVRHGFTHFELVLDLAIARLSAPPAVGDPAARWTPLGELPDAGLPTLFRRAAEAAQSRDLFG